MRKLRAVLVLLLVVACGKRGDPRPPVPVIPKATTDLVVTQRGSRVILTWSYPSLTTAGQSLTGIRRVVVYRMTETLPVPQAGRDAATMQPGDVDPAVPRPVALFAKLPAPTVKQFLKLRDRIDSIEGANLPNATAGAHLMYEDAPALQTSDGRPVRLTYSVVTETSSARGDISNLVAIVPLPVPAAPAGLAAVARPEGVVLSWTKPAAVGDAPLYLAGYNLYRHAANQPGEIGGTPVNAAPLTATTFTDVPPYGDYAYSVRAVASTGPPPIESEPSDVVKATFKDLLPPPAPTGLNVLVETTAARLVWDPVQSPDLWGYFVYRTENGVRLKLTPGPDTVANFIDIGPVPGTEYTYSVSSVDKNGNESAATAAPPILVPKTP